MAIRCVYVEARLGTRAVRIGQTEDLLQRVRRFESRHLPIEVILYGECITWEAAPETAEAKIFRLLADIHLARHNPGLYVQLPTYDWYLPDRHRILNAFSRLCNGEFPLLRGFYRMPLFERLTKIYPPLGRYSA